MIKSSLKPSRVILLACSGIALIALLLAVYLFSIRVFQGNDIEKSQAKLELYKSTISNELTRLEHLPGLLALDPLVLSALKTGQNTSLNIKLKSLSASSRAEALYLMDNTGNTIAASNFDQEQTFLGQNYGFRPYFQQAMEGNNSAFFAIGATTSRPGYFLAAPVYEGNSITGVFALKLDLTALNKSLQSSTDLILVTNLDEIVVLSSDQRYRYKSLGRISENRMSEISLERQFGIEKLDRLKWSESNTQVDLEGDNYFLLQAALKDNTWRLKFLLDGSSAAAQAVALTAFLAACLIGIGTAFIVWRGQRLRRALVASQEDRKRLQREIDVRRKAEHRLETAQKELKRTSKMAALGQLAASVTHELGQPISAMKNHIAAEEIATKKTTPVLKQISSIVGRMESITSQLRLFATPSKIESTQVDLADVSKNAVAMMRHDLANQSIYLIFDTPNSEHFVHGNALRLEQVLINLIRNSVKAMENSDTKKITIEVKSNSITHTVSVSDTGHGLQGQNLDQVTEPFHTTGPSGEGMGLGLAISATIIADHQGTFSAKDIDPTGACFSFTLPRAKVKIDA